MSIAEGLLPEFDQEMATTRRLLARVPSDKGPWKPHPKSFPLGHLAQLVATMPGWLLQMLRDTEINLATSPGYSFETTEALLARLIGMSGTRERRSRRPRTLTSPCCGHSRRVTRCSSPLLAGRWCGHT